MPSKTAALSKQLAKLADERSPGVLRLIKDGSVEVLPGANPVKPVIRAVDPLVFNGKPYGKGQLLAGTGTYPKRTPAEVPHPVDAVREAVGGGFVTAVDSETAVVPVEAVPQERPVVKSGAHREKLYELIPPDADPALRMSLEGLLNDFYHAALGSPQRVECEHPEMHDNRKAAKHVVAFKSDASALWKLIENLVGKAHQTQETVTTNIDIDVLMQIVTEPVAIISVNREEAAEMKKAAFAGGIIDPSWLEVDSTESEAEKGLG